MRRRSGCGCEIGAVETSSADIIEEAMGEALPRAKLKSALAGFLTGGADGCQAGGAYRDGAGDG